MSRLPLPLDLCRCLGHAEPAVRVSPTLTGNICSKADSCARHQTIAWDNPTVSVSVTYHLCEPGSYEHYLAAYAEGRP